MAMFSFTSKYGGRDIFSIFFSSSPCVSVVLECASTHTVENECLFFGSIYEPPNEREEIPEISYLLPMLHYYVVLLYKFFIDCLCMFSDDFIIDFLVVDKCGVARRSFSSFEIDRNAEH